MKNIYYKIKPINYKNKQKLKNPNDKKLLNELYTTNLRLRALMRQKSKGAILRSRARWQEQGEHNTNYFLILTSNQKLIHALGHEMT